ncbi:hypothetical protein RND71_029696 [Anisodus tanguticus]|uniref:Glycosyltransferase n=1 Tax=Anisodus tanguticus TaxID=243964 RepID=A0AAE1RF08_9SOLA|nr:hypothetical protein RND71_029696 [Anisodus tanguticus]
MLPLFDFTHQLVTNEIAITILVTPKNLPILNPLLSKHPLINTLVLPFPSHPSIPAGVENVKDLPAGGFRSMMYTLRKLRDPILDWFNNHPSPPSAIISDMFLGFTHEIATQLGIRRYVFSTSGALALSVVYSLWREMPKRKNTNDENEIFHLPNIPNSPKYPWWQLSPIFRSYVKGDPNSEFIRECYLADIASYGVVFNTFTELENVYLDYLKKDLGHDRVWSVGPVLPPNEDVNNNNNSGSLNRGGSSSVLASEILGWLDTCEDHSVVYVCFGSQAVLTNKQMEELAIALEKSGVKFIWSAKGATKGHVSNDYGAIPSWFEEKVAGRGLVVRDWAPQVLILKHRAVGAFLTHCGWNSTLESLVAGVPMLTWPMGADQFANANILDEHKVAIRACEGVNTIPNSDELTKLLAEAVQGNVEERRARASELRKVALNGIKEGGNSFKDLAAFVQHLREEATKIKR